MAYQERKIPELVPGEIKSRVQFFEKERNEGKYVNELKDKIDEKKIAKKLERDMSLKITGNPFDKAMIRQNHNTNIKSYFNMVEDEDELTQIHEENMKLAIDKYIAGNYAEVKKSEELIKQFRAELDEDFEALFTMYKVNRKGSTSNYKQSLESVKAFYIREMEKHFSEQKFTLSDDLQELHKKYKSLSHDKLREELSNRDIPKVSQQLNESLEIIYEKFKRQNLSNIPVKTAIGIDLGTTYSCVGVMKRGKVHIISNTYGLKTTPSYISFPERGQEFVGQSAKEQAHENPTNTIYDVKRMIGRDYNDIHIQSDMKLWPFNVVNENNILKVKLSSKKNINITLHPEELSAKVLSRLKKDAENFLEYEVNNAVITVPAYFNDAQRQATKDAGLIAGLNVLQILNEPTAAAIAYSHQIREDFRKNVLIYDLGGGTFDVAVVIIENEIIDVKAVDGDTHLGGVDFDQKIMNYLLKTFKKEFSKNYTEEIMARAKARLRLRCEKKKCELSEMTSTTISIDELLPGWDFKYSLERAIFERLCSDLFKKTIAITDKTLKIADIKACDINDVVLIGGSTKIPKIQSLLREYFIDKTLSKEISPDEAVAYGATIQAALLNSETFIDSNRSLIRDVSPFSIGIEVLDKSMFVIIPRNSKIPILKSETFKTTGKNQTFVRIQIYEGEDKIAKKNRLLGEFIIDGLPKKPAGEETVNVIMEIDKEGILHIKGVASSGSANLEVKDHRGRISAEELKMLVNQATNRQPTGSKPTIGNKPATLTKYNYKRD